MDYHCKGGAEAPMPVPSEFAPKGDPKSLSDDGSANAAGESSEPGKALAEFAGLGKAEKISGIKDSGKANLTKTGGPQRVG
jgi:hypothetical protein